MLKKLIDWWQLRWIKRELEVLKAHGLVFEDDKGGYHASPWAPALQKRDGKWHTK